MSASRSFRAIGSFVAAKETARARSPIASAARDSSSMRTLRARAQSRTSRGDIAPNASRIARATSGALSCVHTVATTIAASWSPSRSSFVTARISSDAWTEYIAFERTRSSTNSNSATHHAAHSAASTLAGSELTTHELQNRTRVVSPSDPAITDTAPARQLVHGKTARGKQAGSVCRGRVGRRVGRRARSSKGPVSLPTTVTCIRAGT